jgi:anaerobic C4-dicarboxylate transporter DcuB
MAISSVATQMGITASPVAAAVTTFLAVAAKTSHPVGLFDIIKVTLPAGIAGVLATALWSMNRGKELDQDPDFQDRLRDLSFRTALEADVTTLGKTLPKTAPLSVVLFFGGIFTVVMLALFPALLPHWGTVDLPMTTVVQIVMLGYGAFILFACNVRAADVARSSVSAPA